MQVFAAADSTERGVINLSQKRFKAWSPPSDANKPEDPPHWWMPLALGEFVAAQVAHTTHYQSLRFTPQKQIDLHVPLGHVCPATVHSMCEARAQTHNTCLMKGSECELYAKGFQCSRVDLYRLPTHMKCALGTLWERAGSMGGGGCR